MSFVPTITDRKYAHGKTVSEYTISVTVQLIHQQVFSLSKEEVLRRIESVEKPVKVQIRSVRMYYGEDGSDHGGGEDGQLLPEQHHVQHLFRDGHFEEVRRGGGKDFQRHCRFSEEWCVMNPEEGCEVDREDYEIPDRERSLVLESSRLYYQQENGQ